MKIKTADLIGPALDWAVAQCEGKNGVLHDDGITRCIVIASASGVYKGTYQPSINWSQGGALVEREGINLFKHNKLNESQPDVWCAHKVVPRPNMEGSFNSCALALDGPTPLIAAMRCVVASRLGDEVDVPDELV
jgi:hypothetical protein